MRAVPNAIPCRDLSLPPVVVLGGDTGDMGTNDRSCPPTLPPPPPTTTTPLSPASFPPPPPPSSTFKLLTQMSATSGDDAVITIVVPSVNANDQDAPSPPLAGRMRPTRATSRANNHEPSG